MFRTVLMSAVLLAAGLSSGRPRCPLADVAARVPQSCCTMAGNAPHCCSDAGTCHAEEQALVPDLALERIIPLCPHCPPTGPAPCCRSAPARTVTAVRVDPYRVEKDDAESSVLLSPCPRLSGRSPERSAFESRVASSLDSIPVARHVRFCVWLV